MSIFHKDLIVVQLGVLLAVVNPSLGFKAVDGCPLLAASCMTGTCSITTR